MRARLCQNLKEEVVEEADPGWGAELNKKSNIQEKLASLASSQPENIEMSKRASTKQSIESMGGDPVNQILALNPGNLVRKKAIAIDLTQHE